MKTILLLFLLTVSLTGISEAKPTCYYWVVETSTYSNTASIIRIYNNKHELIYTEHVEKTLDITNRKVNKALNRKARKLRALKEK